MGHSATREDPREGTSAALRLDDQLCFALYAATHAIIRRYRPLLGALGLTYPQYLVMMALWQEGATSVGAIGRRLEIDSHAVSPMVDRLVAAGLVQRRRGADRRQVLVEPTARGRALEGAASRAQAQVAGETGLGASDLADLRGRLVELVDHLAPDTTADLRPTPHPAGRADTPRGDAS